MKPTSLHFLAMLTGAAVFAASTVHARSFGVSSSAAGRGTMYTTSRGGQAYVGPRGVAGETAGGRYGAATERGAAVAGPNGAAATGRYGSAAVTQNGAAVAGRYGAAYAGENGAAYAGRYGAAYAGRYGGAAVAASGYAAATTLPAGYIRTLPPGAQPINYAGYTCLFAAGFYYRPVIYGGETVYVIVQ